MYMYTWQWKFDFFRLGFTGKNWCRMKECLSSTWGSIVSLFKKRQQSVQARLISCTINSEELNSEELKQRDWNNDHIHARINLHIEEYYGIFLRSLLVKGEYHWDKCTLLALTGPLYWGLCVLIWDLDECASGIHNCHDLGVCTNNVGSFTCHCQRGYTGNGMWCTGKVVIIFWYFPFFSLRRWSSTSWLSRPSLVSYHFFICNTWWSIWQRPQF